MGEGLLFHGDLFYKDADGKFKPVGTFGKIKTTFIDPVDIDMPDHERLNLKELSKGAVIET